MTTGFDLDEIERLLAAATVGDWWNEGCEIFYALNGGLRTLIYDEGGHTEEDAALIVTLKRSAPAMIAEIRKLRAENARLALLNEALRMQRDSAHTALKPFAKLAIWIKRNRTHRYTTGDEVQIENWPYTLSVGELMVARAALGEPQ